MKTKRKKLSVVTLKANKKSSYWTIVWIVCLSSALLMGYLSCLNQTWLQIHPSIGMQAATAALTMLCCIAVYRFSANRSYAYILLLLPFSFLWFLSDNGNPINGARAWINMLYYQWSIFYEGITQSMSFSVSEADALSFVLLASVLLTEIVWFLAAKRQIIITCIVAVLILFLQLMTGNISVLGCGSTVLAVIGLIISDNDMHISKRGVIWTCSTGLILCLCLFVFPKEQIESIDILRYDTKTAIHTLRYGEDSLPQGNVRDAAALHANNDAKMMQVSSNQQKDIYLRAFVGGIYQDGIWKAMPKSTYRNEHFGMLAWLKSRNFDPLTQSAAYHELDTNHDEPERNTLEINVSGASRCYLYTPASLEKISSLIVKDMDDTRIMSKGFLGRKNYKMTEFSGIKPSELTVASEWLNYPETKEQKDYTESEAVYRDFVYETYTAADTRVYHKLKDLFWNDYEAENDGIFSAVEQIRKKLRQYLSYTEEPAAAPTGKEPILWALTSSHEGNAIVYASIATEALRVHGIPTRYIEGYYISEKAFSENDNIVSVTGRNAHAWIEVYFDGIGWLPLDVTPGYYYDTTGLQKLVSAPNTTHKNAVLNDNSFEGTEIADSNGNSSDSKPPELLNSRNVLLLIIGLLSLFAVAISVLLATFELWRIVKIMRGKRQYELANSFERVNLNRERIYYLLSLWNIEARLGWKTKEVDQQIASTVSGIEPGDYARVCKIIEKTIYGQIPSEDYEERTVLIFLRKLYTPNNSYGWKKKLQLRYANLLF